MAQKAGVTYKTDSGIVTRIVDVEKVEMNTGGHAPIKIFEPNMDYATIYAFAIDFRV